MAAILTASNPCGGVAAWEKAVVEEIGALARELRPATGTLRVLVGVGAHALAEPYLEARARVVGVGSVGPAAPPEDARYHVQRGADAHGLPQGCRGDDADLILMPWTDGLERALDGVARALAAGGVAVLGVRGERASVEVQRAERLAGAAGLALARVVRVGPEREVDGLGAQPVAVVAVMDRRHATPLPSALDGLDRTMCVDRAQVLRALEGEPWRGEGTARAAVLVEALGQQLVHGEPELRALPWQPTVEGPAPGAAGVDVLVVMPHPDDESVYAGGTVAGLVAAGQRVKVVVATAGAGGRGGQDLGRRRAQELVEAAGALGVTGLRCLGWADFGKYRDLGRTTPVTAGDTLRAWGLERALHELVGEIRRERPRVLLGLDPEVDPNYSLHGHHLGLGVLLAVAFHAAADPEYAPQRGRAWACEEHRVLAPVGHEPWGERVEIDRAVKQRALRAHASQAYSTAPVLEALAARTRPAVEITRRVQARRASAWWVARRGAGTSLDAGIDWASEAVRVRSRARPRAALVEALRQQAGASAGDPAVEASLRRLAREHAVAVVTGQQVGLLGGPAYTLAKALTAVALARRLQRRGIEAVPVFWLASYDHDLREVQRVPQLGAPTLRLGLADTGGPVGARRLGEGIEGLCERWVAALPPEHAAEVVAWVRRTHRAEQDFSGAFGGLLREITRGSGLLLLDPSDPAIARLARPLLQRAVVEASAVEQALAAARERLRAQGEREVVPTGREALSLVFGLDEHGARRRVTRRDDVGALVAAMERQPERFSPAALLRPLVQDAVLPTIAYVAGPTERRYLEQTHELYAWAGLPRPRVVPRVSLLLAEAHDVAMLAPVGGLEALRGAARPLERIGRAGLTAPAVAWLDEVEAILGGLRLRPELRGQLERLHALATTALPSLPRTARSWPRARAALHEHAAAVLEGTASSPARALTRLRHALVGLRRSILREGRRARPEALAAWGRVGSVPAPPERRMTVAELLARGGPGLGHGVLAALEQELSPTLELQIGGRR